MPFSVTGSKGLPQANSARPSVQRYASSAVHSDCDVGFDSANTIGRALIRAMSCRTSGVNVPPTAATPMIAVGASVLTAVGKSAIGGWSCA